MRQKAKVPSLAPTWRRRLYVTLGLVLFVIAVLFWLQRDPIDRMHERHGKLVDIEVGAPIDVEGKLIDREVHLTSSSGLRVELLVRRPAGELGKSPRPAVLLLGGIRTGKTSAQLVPDTHGTIVVGMSYPTHLTKIRELSHILPARRAVIDTPPALMLAVDYLLTREDVDPERIELLGVSLGAPFVCVAGALDPRIARIWSMYGGGDPERLFDQSLKKEVGSPWLRRPAAWLLTVLSYAAVLAPEDYVAEIAPRPFVMINADADERIPRECVEVLYAAAREPKELVWIEGGHLDKHDLEQVTRLVDLVLSRRGR